MKHAHDEDQLNLFNEIIVDNFAGGGGASTGIFMALGRSPEIAINHDIEAIRMHEVNHPESKHYCESVWDVEPREAVQGRPVGLVWLSPDCKHFSKAKGSKPVSKKIRALAWIALKWIGQVRPRVLILENVEEFITWGPCIKDADGNSYPDPKKKGRTFNSFVNAMRYQGYKVEWKELRACDYGAPTIRKRLFLIARCDGAAITWPKPTHGKPDSELVLKGKLKPWRSAAEIIDWSIPCPSIFDRKKPLAENTLKRIAKGIQRFVIDAKQPFIVKCNHTSNVTKYDAFRGQDINEPLQTITQSPGFAVVEPTFAPFITEHANASNQRNMAVNEPLRTICAQVKGGHFAVVSPVITRQFGNSVGHAVSEPLGTVTAGGGGKSQLVAAFLAKHYGGNYTGAGADLNDPTPTVTTVDHNALVTSSLIKMRGTNIGSPVTDPVHTITAGGTHIGEVRAFLLKYYGADIGHETDSPLHTVTTKDRFGLVTIQGEDWQIVDIGMRMLTPKELYAASGFPSDYIIDVDSNGKPITKTNQVARCGNAVVPSIAQALVSANVPEMKVIKKQKEVAA